MPIIFVCVERKACVLEGDCAISKDLLKDISNPMMEAHPAYKGIGVWVPKYHREGVARPLDFSNCKIEGFLFKVAECLRGALKIEVDRLFDHHEAVMGGAVSHQREDPPSSVWPSKKMFRHVILNKGDLNMFVGHLYEKSIEKKATRPKTMEDLFRKVAHDLQHLDKALG